ncbi:MAG TPA: SpoIVB peptidase S55 domain-containing protein [Bryobacteraceae bacterium]|nr:SpoIVB peptidase S55 domain-containing protein [Bryobacteraceae bacterium]
MACRFWFLTILASSLFAEIPIFPLKDVRPGQHGIGKTIFTGNRIDDFDVEVLGVLENLGPKQSVILARLSGRQVEESGVMQGMSGSPVYIDGKLVGAVALAFSFAKEPIAGIRPIEEMLRAGGQTEKQLEARPAALFRQTLLPPAPEQEATRPDRMTPIATPVSFSGFSDRTLDYFAPQLRRLGLEPRQGLSSGGHLPPAMGSPATLRPGDMITVQLLSGDLSVGADGTVTAVDGNRVYAFGHQFLSVGRTELPFARADVITVLPNLQSSFKISSAREWMGAITQDRSTAIYGELGRHAATIPLAIDVSGGQGSLSRYRMQMVSDQILSPFLVQMAVFSAIETTERTFGAGTFVIRGEATFDNRTVAPLKFDNTYSGDFSVPQQASMGVASSLAYVMAAGFEALRLRDVSIRIDAVEQKRTLEIDQVAASRHYVRPGEPLDISVTLSGPNGMEVVRTVRYRVPVGVAAGMLQVTAADALTTNLLEYGQAIGVTPKSAGQVVLLLNDLRPNTKAFVRVWTTDAAYTVQGADLPDPPPSLGLILARTQAAPGTVAMARGSELADLAIDAGPYVVTGSKTIQVEVKE